MAKILISSGASLEVKGKVYRVCVQRVMYMVGNSFIPERPFKDARISVPEIPGNKNGKFPGILECHFFSNILQFTGASQHAKPHIMLNSAAVHKFQEEVHVAMVGRDHFSGFAQRHPDLSFCAGCARLALEWLLGKCFVGPGYLIPITAVCPHPSDVASQTSAAAVSVLSRWWITESTRKWDVE